jgi:hypothetical protein
MLKRKGIRGRSVHRTEVVVDRDNFGRKILASFVMIAKYAAEGNCEMDREQKK